MFASAQAGEREMGGREWERFKKMRMRCKKMNDMKYDKEMIALKHCKKMTWKKDNMK